MDSARLPAFQNQTPGDGPSRGSARDDGGAPEGHYLIFHPLYAGADAEAAAPVARLAYALAMWLNPTITRWMAGGRPRRWKESGCRDRRDVRLKIF